MEERKYIGNNNSNTCASFDDLTEENQQSISQRTDNYYDRAPFNVLSERKHEISLTVLKLAADEATDQNNSSYINTIRE